MVLPNGPLADEDLTRVVNLVAFGCYLLVGALRGAGRFRMKVGGAEKEMRRELYGPLQLTTVQAALWLTAALGFGALNAQYSWRLALSVTETTLLGPGGRRGHGDAGCRAAARPVGGGRFGYARWQHLDRR